MRLRFAMFLLCLGSLPALAQTPDQLYTATPQQLAVTKIVLAQEAAWNKGDLEGFLSHFKDAADTQVILATPVRGMPNVRMAFRINYPNREAMGALENTEVEVRELGEKFALCTGKYRLTRTKKGGGNAEGSFTELFEKTTAGWQVIFSEST